MANPVKLNYEWKKSFSSALSEPFSMLVSFWDLIAWYDAKVKNDKARANMLASSSNFKSKGLELPHNIIAFDENIYTKSDKGHRVIEPTDDPDATYGTHFNTWAVRGFDLCLPKFDLRSRPLYLTANNVADYVPGATEQDFNGLNSTIKPRALDPEDFYYGKGPGFKIWDKSAILRPVTTFDFYTQSPQYQGIPDPLDDKANTWADYPADRTYQLGVEKDYEDGIKNADIILSNEDLSFKQKYLGQGEITAYNGLCLNYNSSYVWKLMFKYYAGDGTPTSLIVVDTSTLNIDSDGHDYNLKKFLFQNTWVWVRAPFYADYVDYRDFNQKLDQTSEVKFKNLLLADTGDLDRFNKAFSSNPKEISAMDYAKNTRPYISQVPPSIDLVGPQILPEGKWNPDNASVTINNLISDADGPNSKVGALNLEPFEWDNSLDNTTNWTSPETIPPPPPYFDPDSRKPATSYNDIPVVVPKDGVLHSSGRVISPTIDEIWYEIKELLGGRISDASVRPDGGYPTGNSGSSNYNPKDTTPRLKKHNLPATGFAQTSPAQGDPLEINYNFDDPVQAIYTVTKWISDPSKISYSLLIELDQLNKLLCRWNGTQYMYPTADINVLTKPDNTEDVNQNNRYLPRTNPYSLREIEGILKGLQWNLTYFLTYLKRNNTWAGSVGQPNEDDPNSNPSNINAGTIYQLHRNYDGLDSRGKSNTQWDQRVDIQGAMPIGAKGTGLGSINDSQIPIDQNYTPSWAVYVGADGQFHSLTQYNIVPLYDSETW
jgi:hypothetical protein